MNRREFLKTSGVLVIGFSLFNAFSPDASLAQGRSILPASLMRHPEIDAWLQIHADGTVTVFTGKIELGQGIKTALLQIAAEELDVNFERLRIVQADTGRTPDEGLTAGSRSVEQSGMAIRSAAAEARAILMALAAEALGEPAERLQVDDGVVRSENRRETAVTYWKLIGGRRFESRATGTVRLKNPADYRIVGQPVLHIDIPAMVSGAPLYVQDLRPQGMVHARVVRPPAYGAELEAVDDLDAVQAMPGVLKVVRDGSYLAVIAEREEQTMKAAAALKKKARWSAGRPLPGSENLSQHLRQLPARLEQVRKAKDIEGALQKAAVRLKASYTKPYLMHGSIGPSCAVAQMANDRLTVWTHSQGVYPLRQALAGLLRMDEENIQAVGVQGSGCYGHNGADDVAADAALLARAFPGQPVRVQWSREDEHGWEPYGSAMVMDLEAGLNEQGEISAWSYTLISDSHATRPRGQGEWLLPGWHIGRKLTPRDRGFTAGAHRNAEPLYDLPAAEVTAKIVEGPLRVSALRSLGAYANIFAIESFMDELAEKAGMDPVVFRLRHLKDQRARAVVEAAATAAGWDGEQLPPGVGIGFARYKNTAAYCAVAVEAASPAPGQVRIVRAVAAVDAGQTINPDGLRNQIEGGILQSASWTLMEEVRFDESGIISCDWATYPILRITDSFPVEVQVLDHPDAPPLGAGEASQGPAAAAVVNAIYHSTGVRVRNLPVVDHPEVSLDLAHP